MSKKILKIVLALLKLAGKFVPANKVKVLAILSILGVVVTATIGSMDQGWLDGIIPVVDAVSNAVPELGLGDLL